MKEMTLVGAGGFIGACLRYIISNSLINFNRFGFPWNTLSINVLGCFCLGIAVGLGLDDNSSKPLKEFVVLGILGGFTTFSAFGMETFKLINLGSYKLSLIYVLSSFIMSIFAIGLGLILVSWK